jgi:hypothetical protein
MGMKMIKNEFSRCNKSLAEIHTRDLPKKEQKGKQRGRGVRNLLHEMRSVSLSGELNLRQSLSSETMHATQTQDVGMQS